MEEIPGKIILTLGKRHTGVTLVTGMALRILFTSCGSKVRATSETQIDGRALRNRQGTRNRDLGCDNVLQN